MREFQERVQSFMRGREDDDQSDDGPLLWNGQSESAKSECLPSLTKKQRIMAFLACLLMGILCFALASVFLPVLALRARKFAVLYTFGSVFCMASFSFLWGPAKHMKHLFSGDRIPFSATYLLSIAATLYCALVMQSTVLTVVFAVMQVGAFIWYLVSYIPGGQRGMRFFTSILYTVCSKTVAHTLPV